MPSHEIALLLLVSVAAWTDVQTGRIHNALTYPACVVGLLLGLGRGGAAGLLDSLAGLAVAFVPFFLLYLTGGMGGGDVKLMAAVGALMGLEFTIRALPSTVFVGALIAIVIVIWEGKIRETLLFLARTLGRLVGVGRPEPTLDVQAQVPFGVAICLASFLTLVASWQGAHSPWHILSQAGGGGWG